MVGLEKALASRHWDNVTLRDPQKTYNLKTAEEAVELFPLLDTWLRLAASCRKTRRDRGQHAGFLRRRGRPAGIGTPGRVEGMADPEGGQLAAAYLSSGFVDTNFDFYGTTDGERRTRSAGSGGSPSSRHHSARQSARSTCRAIFPRPTRPMQTLVANLIEAYRQSIRWRGWARTLS